MKNKVLIKNGIRGFTLIEILVVISIIGLLSTIVLTSLNSSRTKALTTKAKMDMNQIVKAMTIAQGESGKYLKDITGSGCSSCSGGRTAGFDYRNIPNTDQFYIAWVTSLTKIESATNGLMVGVSNITRDPWGSPYSMDENEGEGNGCGYDTLRSYGPDGIMSTSDDIVSATIPHIKCP